MQWLKKYYSEKFVHNKYNHLLIGTIVLFLIAPLYLQTGLKFPLIGFLFFLILQLALRATVTDKKKLKYYAILTLIGLACTLISKHGPSDPKISTSLYIIGRAIYSSFLIIAIRIFLAKLFAARIMTSDRIKGSICVYFLLGILGSFLYEIIYHFDSGAFQVAQITPMTFIYYSFSVLTTLGFGDIIPLNNMAISLTCLHAVTGQMYLVIIIARLIGVYISQEHNQIIKEVIEQRPEQIDNIKGKGQK
jgi:hypothetical protein